MTENPSKHETAQVVAFPDAEERARRLRVEVERLARLPTVEWMFYLDDSAKKHGVEPGKLKAMIEATIKETEKKAREEKVEQQRIEQRAEKQRATDKRERGRKQERKERDEERKREREEREARKEAERSDREKQKAFEAIVKLPSSEHEGKLRTLARQLGEDVEVLTQEFLELRVEEEERIKRGEVEPWDAPVNTRELLDAVTAQFEKYIIIHDRIIAPIIPLWIAFAWVHDIAAFSPILIIESADSGEGKTAASKSIALLTPRSHIIVEPTGPAFYRFIDRIHPTLIIDDADRLLPRRPDLAHIVNASWTRGVPIPRVDNTGNVHFFDPFCPKVLNGIDLLAHLAPATRTRCITIKLLPKLEDEEVADHRHADSDENFVILRRKFLRWVIDNMTALDKAEPKMPDGFFSRLKENYHLLFAIADLAGGDWPKKARAAAVKLSREHNMPSLGRRLLAIFYDLFSRYGELLTSKQVEQALPAYGDEWDNYKNRGRAINKWEVAQLLQPFKIFPGVIHPRGHAADRGYAVGQFEVAFRHYLGKPPPQGRTVVRRGKR
jgi:putative DNA primase/helicase